MIRYILHLILLSLLFLILNWKLQIVYLVSWNTCSSKIFNIKISYLSIKCFLNLISFLRIEDIKFNGRINISPKHLELIKIIKILIKHLYKSFVSYISYNFLFIDLFLAKYGGFVNINELSKFGGSNIVSCLIIKSFLGSIS